MSEQELLRDQKAKKPQKRVWQAPPDDRLCGVATSPDLHYVRVEEHPVSWGLPSVKAKMLSQGYKIEHQVEGTEIYIMSIPKEKFDAQKQAAQDLARERRGQIGKDAQSQGLNHFRSERRRVGLEELAASEDFNS